MAEHARDMIANASGNALALEQIAYRLESQLAASQERVRELEGENTDLRSDLASVCVWLCDWDEGIEAGNAVALAKHVKEVCKDRGHRLTEQRARAETAERRVAELERENASMRGLPSYKLGYVDGRCDAETAVHALSERHARMGHIETVDDALDYAAREAAGELTESGREDLLTRAETAERERDEAIERADQAGQDWKRVIEMNLDNRPTWRDAAETFRRERDRYHDALVARHGGEPVSLLDELETVRRERDALSAEVQALKFGLGATEYQSSEARRERDEARQQSEIRAESYLREADNAHQARRERDELQEKVTALEYRLGVTRNQRDEAVARAEAWDFLCRERLRLTPNPDGSWFATIEFDPHRSYTSPACVTPEGAIEACRAFLDYGNTDNATRPDPERNKDDNGIREVVVPVLQTNPEADRIADDLFSRDPDRSDAGGEEG